MNVKKFTRQKFEVIRERLSVEIRGAHDDYDLHALLDRQLSQQLHSANQSRVFWTLSRNALLNSALSRLCRVYDNEYIGIPMYLKIVRQNPDWFNKHRVSKAPEHLREFARPFKAQTLQRAIDSVSKSHGTRVNSLVDGLLELRNQHVAHIGTRIVGSSQPMPARKLTYRGFKTLLTRSIRLLNLYSKYYDGHTYSTNMPGIDDFMFVTDAVQERFLRSRKSI